MSHEIEAPTVIIADGTALTVGESSALAQRQDRPCTYRWILRCLGGTNWY